MLNGIAAALGQWAKELLKNPTLWVMLVLPAAMAWVVGHATGASAVLAPLWLVFAQLMTGLMLASGHWLEERQQGTWQALRVSPVPIGWLLAAQAALVTVLTLLSELLVFALNRAGAPFTPAVLAFMLVGAVFATLLGVLIGVASPSARSGNLLATLAMLVLFLAAVAGQGVAGGTDLRPILGWLPSVLTLSAFGAAFSAALPSLAELLGLALWLVALVVALRLALRRQYADGR